MGEGLGVWDERTQKADTFETKMLFAGLTIKRIFLKIKGLETPGRITSGFATGFGNPMVRGARQAMESPKVRYDLLNTTANNNWQPR